PRPVKFRGAGFAPGTSRSSGWIALALVIAVWQFAGSTSLVNPLFLPAPSAIAVATYKLAMSGALWQHLGWSVMRIGSGWLLALQLRFWKMSESVGNHDSEVVDASSVD